MFSESLSNLCRSSLSIQRFLESNTGHDAASFHLGMHAHLVIQLSNWLEQTVPTFVRPSLRKSPTAQPYSSPLRVANMAPLNPELIEGNVLPGMPPQFK